MPHDDRGTYIVLFLLADSPGNFAFYL